MFLAKSPWGETLRKALADFRWIGVSLHPRYRSKTILLLLRWIRPTKLWKRRVEAVWDWAPHLAIMENLTPKCLAARSHWNRLNHGRAKVVDQPFQSRKNHFVATNLCFLSHRWNPKNQQSSESLKRKSLQPRKGSPRRKREVCQGRRRYQSWRIRSSKSIWIKIFVKRSSPSTKLTRDSLKETSEDKWKRYLLSFKLSKERKSWPRWHRRLITFWRETSWTWR